MRWITYTQPNNPLTTTHSGIPVVTHLLPSFPKTPISSISPSPPLQTPKVAWDFDFPLYFTFPNKDMANRTHTLMFSFLV